MSLNQIYKGTGIHNLFTNNCIVTADLNIKKPFGPNKIYRESLFNNPWEDYSDDDSLSLTHYITRLLSQIISTSDFAPIGFDAVPISDGSGNKIARVGNNELSAIEFDSTLNAHFLVYIKYSINVYETGDCYEFRIEKKTAADFTQPTEGWTGYNYGDCTTTVLNSAPAVIPGVNTTRQTFTLSFPIDTYAVPAGQKFFIRVVAKKISSYSRNSEIESDYTCLSILKVS